MPTLNSEMIIKISADIKDFNGKLDEVQRKTADLTEGLSKTAQAAGIAFAGITAAIGVNIAEFAKQEQAEFRTQAVLKSTGEIAEVSAQQVFNLATSFQKTTTFADETVIAGENLLLTFKNIGKDIFPQATAAILDMATAMGQDLQSTAIQVGKALQDPILGVTALRRVGVQLNESQKAQIENFVAINDLAGAQAIILKELQSEFGGAAEAAAKGTGQILVLKNMILELSESIGKELFESLSGVVKELKEFFIALNDNKALVSIIASTLKYSAVIAGVITGLATLGLASVKIAAVIGALDAAFLGGAIAASSFWVALTGPVGIALLALGAVSAAIYGVYKALDKGEENKTLKQVNEQLAQLKKEAKEYSSDGTAESDLRLKQINDEIAKLEELRKQKLKNNEVDDSKPFGVEKSNQGSGSLKTGLDAEDLGLEKINAPSLRAQQIKNNEIKEADAAAVIAKARRDAEEEADKEILKERKALNKDLVDAGKTEEQHLDDLHDRRIKIAQDAEKILLAQNKDGEAGRNKIHQESLKLQSEIDKAFGDKYIDLLVKQHDHEVELEKKKIARVEKERADSLKRVQEAANNPFSAGDAFAKIDRERLATDTDADVQKKKNQVLAGAGAGVLNNVANGAAGAKTLVTEAGALGVDALGSLAGIPGLGQALKPLIGALTGGPEATRAFVKSFTDAIPDLIQGLIEAIPVLIEELANQFPVIIDRLAQKAPDIIKALVHEMPKVAVALALEMPKVGLALIKEAPNIAVELINSLVKEAPRFVTELIKSIGKGVAGPLGSVGGVLGDIGGGILGGLGDIGSSIGDVFGFAEGGQAFAKSVPTGFPNDTYNAKLTTGELVVDRSTAKGLKEFIDGQGKGGSDVNTALLNKIAALLERPIDVTATAMVKEKAFADIILQLNRNNARLS